jgi:hypothetical protein
MRWEIKKPVYIVHTMHCDKVRNLRNTNKCTSLYFFRTIFYVAPTCFGVIISPYSESWHQSFYKTYSNTIGHNMHIHVVVPIVQNITCNILHYWYHCTIDTTALLIPLHYWFHCTIDDTTALLIPLHYWYHCTIDTTALLISLNYWYHCTIDTTALLIPLHYWCWDIRKRGLVVTDVSWTAWPVKMGPIGCSETS